MFILSEVKEDENFNHRNTVVFRGLKFKSTQRLGKMGIFKGLNEKGEVNMSNQSKPDHPYPLERYRRPVSYGPGGLGRSKPAGRKNF